MYFPFSSYTSRSHLQAVFLLYTVLSTEAAAFVMPISSNMAAA
jgi:hypothetical protein